ncbi:hypothetical protein [Intestinibacter bartlettii]|uniref:Uncharacterized protein n=3 Tax=Bacillota TaxID=1239 RepID=A0A6N3CX20_9FIRM
MEDIKIKDRSMSEIFEVRGYWGINRKIDELEVFGTLKYSKDGIVLELLGKLNHKIDDFYDEKFDSIYGFTVSGEFISLYNCNPMNEKVNMPGLIIHEYSIDSFLVGGFHSINDIYFNDSDVYLSNFNKWLGKRYINISLENKDGRITKNSYTIDTESCKRNLFSINFENKSFTINEQFKFKNYHGLDNVNLNGVAYLNFITEKTENLAYQFESFNKIRKLISFLSNKPIYFDMIHIKPDQLKDYEGKEYSNHHKLAYFFRQIGDITNDNYINFLKYTDISSNINDIFNKWINNSEKIIPIYDLISADSYMNYYEETVFLDSARALEVFHRELIGDSCEEDYIYSEKINYYKNILKDFIIKDIDDEYQEYFLDRINYPDNVNFTRRLREILNILNDTTKNQFIKRNNKSLSKSKSSLERKIVDTRNYFTHKDERSKTKPNVVHNTLKLKAISSLMKCICIILIGKYIGIDEDIMVEKLKNSSMQSIINDYWINQ